MLSKIYCVYDCKVEAYLQPFFMASRGAAIRSFGEVVNDPKTQFNRYPADFTLFELGEYDDQNAKFVLHNAPVALGVAIEYLKSTPVLPPNVELPFEDSL